MPTDPAATDAATRSEETPSAAGELNGHQTIARLADEVLPLLISRLSASGLGELEVRQNGWRVRLRRSAQGVAAEEHSSTIRPRTAALAERRTDNPGGGESTAPEHSTRRERGRVAISAPAVGYYQPRDGLAIGTAVRGGDVVGHVEVLGVRQDVVIPENGIIVALTAEAGEAVEYGQALARLEPEARS